MAGFGFDCTHPSTVTLFAPATRVTVTAAVPAAVIAVSTEVDDHVAGSGRSACHTFDNTLVPFTWNRTLRTPVPGIA